MGRRHGHRAVALSSSVLGMFLCALLATLLGSHSVSLLRALQGVSSDREILITLRVPRTLLALWTGGALSLAGVLFQALLRNALADPYTLGVSGGASLGAVVAIFFGWGTVGHFSAVSVAASVGSALVLLLLVGMSSQGGTMSSASLLLAGVTIGTMCGAAILFLSNLVGFLQSFSATRWLMGGIDAPSYSTLAWLSVVLVPACLIIFWHSREWNLLAVGENWAATRGVSPSRLLLLGCIAGCVLTGAITALTGPIGFVGLIIPHALRSWVGADHRILMPCSFFVGAGFVALCDVLSRTLLAPVEIPVGVITALLGGPFFIWMLRSRRTSRMDL